MTLPSRALVGVAREKPAAKPIGTRGAEMVGPIAHSISRQVLAARGLLWHQPVAPPQLVGGGAGGTRRSRDERLETMDWFESVIWLSLVCPPPLGQRAPMNSTKQPLDLSLGWMPLVSVEPRGYGTGEKCLRQVISASPQR